MKNKKLLTLLFIFSFGLLTSCGIFEKTEQAPEIQNNCVITLNNGFKIKVDPHPQGATELTFSFLDEFFEDCDKLIYTWDFGDGTATEHGKKVTHQFIVPFQSSRTYNVRLTIRCACCNTIACNGCIYDSYGSYCFLPTARYVKLTDIHSQIVPIVISG